MSRRELLMQIADLVGRDVISVVDPGDGWPGTVDIRLPSGSLMRCVLHVGPIGRSHRDRDAVERRFQNPGQGRPVQAPAESLPLLLGFWNGGQRPVLVGMETEGRHSGATRQSYFSPLWMLEMAAQKGWAQHTSASEERIIAFQPPLLPAYVEVRKEGLPLPDDQIMQVVDASGMAASEIETAAERARRMASSLIRNRAFSRDVVEAYEGFCAMCGLDLGLVQGAHVYPVAAPSSCDEVWNGVALCGNHHSAFDGHRIWADPTTREIRIHPELHERASVSAASRAFLTSTLRHLRAPTSPPLAPRPEMFERRYAFYEGRYAWANGS